MNINELQTPAFRKFKYTQAREAGATRAYAGKIRDYETMAFIKCLSIMQNRDVQDAGREFFRDLEETGIQCYKNTPVKSHILKPDIPTK